ncbi:MAG: formylglycine-generating enzyme family protein [Sedimentisphaerales bacterium]|jgi:formylglycine-generating enzyme required for sulfatase activity
MKKIITTSMVLLIAAVVVAVERTQLQESPATQQQKMAAAKANLPLEKTIALGNDVTMVFVFIPAGEFEMGSPKSEKKRDKDEGPVHHVKISKPFYMGKYEVTQIQYQTIFHSTEKIFYSKDFNNPADRVSFNQANRFAEELSLLYRKTGLRFRLPTEAEWEYACRAGTTTPFYTGETINSEQANYDATAVYGNGVKGKYMERAVAVGSYPPNPFGLYDMHGNVWEWCRDRYIKYFYQDSPAVDPMAGGDEPIRRGGAWDSEPEDCRSANRDCRKSWRHMDDTGFRIVLEIEQK